MKIGRHRLIFLLSVRDYEDKYIHISVVITFFSYWYSAIVLCEYILKDVALSVDERSAADKVLYSRKAFG